MDDSKRPIINYEIESGIKIFIQGKLKEKHAEEVTLILFKLFHGGHKVEWNKLVQQRQILTCSNMWGQNCF